MVEIPRKMLTIPDDAMGRLMPLGCDEGLAG